VHDVVIVGAGSAGCVLASRLSEDPRRRILLLEAGGDDNRMQIRVPAAFSKLFRSDVDWEYWTEPQQELDGRRVYWPRGRCLGGTSSINATMAIPGHVSDYDGWGEGWSFADVATAYERVDEALAVEELRDPNPLTRAFLVAAGEAGIAPSSLRLTDLEGVRLTRVTQRRGRRWSAADAYLRPALDRPNLDVRTDVHVARVVLDGGRAVGVEHAGGIVEAREVVLAGGAVNSPQLLLLSGIDLPGIGENLQDHLASGVLVAATQPLTLLAAERPGQLVRYLVRRRGMLTSSVAEAAAFVRTRPGLAAPDLELVFAPVLFENEGLTQPSAHGFTIGAVALQPYARGTVTLRSSDPFEPPAIDPRYLSDPRDRETLHAGVELARKIASMPALAPFAGDELAPGTEPVDASIRALAQTLYHPVGTCAIGSVVDRELRVLGVDGLRVVDASVIPHIPRGHTHLPTLMIAERAAEMISSARGTSDSRPAVAAPRRS
jgi:choline dehydrogenase